MQTGGMQTGGMQTGGMQTGGMATGGMQTGGSMTGTCADGDGMCPSNCNADNDMDCIDCTNINAWPTAWVMFEDQVIIEVNQRRAQGATCMEGGNPTFAPGGSPVSMDPNLRISARCHSMDMEIANFTSHTGSDGSNFVARNNRAGFTGRSRGENIAWGQGSPAAVVNAWMGSTTGHCSNIMQGNISLMGIGFVDDIDGVSSNSGNNWTEERLWTMVTGRP